MLSTKLLFILLLLSLSSCTVHSITCTITTEDNSLQLSNTCEIPSKTANTKKNPSANWEIHVDDSKYLQTIRGFGAAWTDATVNVFDTLSSTNASNLMKDLFDPTNQNGIKLSLIRHTVGQSDLTPSSLGQWSYDENGGRPDDSKLSHFGLTDPGNRMVDWIIKMYSYNPNITLFGSVWSPPTWMKYNENNTLIPKLYSSWVEYMLKYLQAFKDKGVDVDGITLQNEPLHSGDPAWTTSMSAKVQVELANLILPKLGKTKIYAYDHNTDRPDYPQYVIDNTNITTVAWHCYAAALNNEERWSPLSKFRIKNPNIEQIMTECWTHLNTGEHFFDLSTFISRPVTHGASGALAWTLGGSTRYDVSFNDGCKQCSGLVQIDRETGEVFKTSDYYTIGQFSKFVSPGDRVYNVTVGNWDYFDGTGVHTNVFDVQGEGNQIVIVIQNLIHNDLMIQVNFDSRNISYLGKVPGRSIVTWTVEV